MQQKLFHRKLKNSWFKTGLKFLGYICTFLLFISSVYFLTLFKKIDFGNSSDYKRDQVYEILKQNFDKSLFLINSKELSAEINKEIIGISNVVLKKAFPFEIKIFYEQRQPKATLKTAQNNSFILDKEAYVLDLKSDGIKYYPVIEINKTDKEIKIGDNVGSTLVLCALYLLEQPSFVDNMEKITIDTGVTVFLKQNIKILVANECYLRSKQGSISSLPLILKELSSGVKVPSQIDLRFKSAYIVY